jgi:hypothetical protein
MDHPAVGDIFKWVRSDKQEVYLLIMEVDEYAETFAAFNFTTGSFNNHTWHYDKETLQYGRFEQVG